MLFLVLLFRCGGEADGQGLVAAHCKLSRMRPHGGGDDDDDDEDNDNNDDDDDDDDDDN